MVDHSGDMASQPTTTRLHVAASARIIERMKGTSTAAAAAGAFELTGCHRLTFCTPFGDRATVAVSASGDALRVAVGAWARSTPREIRHGQHPDPHHVP